MKKLFETSQALQKKKLLDKAIECIAQNKFDSAGKFLFAVGQDSEGTDEVVKWYLFAACYGNSNASNIILGNSDRYPDLHIQIQSLSYKIQTKSFAEASHIIDCFLAIYDCYKYLYDKNKKVWFSPDAEQITRQKCF